MSTSLDSLRNVADPVRRVAFKSPATIAKGQETAKYDGEAGVLAARGRHDPCVVPRYVPACLSTRLTRPSALCRLSRPWPLSSSSSASLSLLCSLLTLPSQILMQNARKASAALLPALVVPLPPSMVMPPPKVLAQAVEDMTKA